ncbi:unnamed protein product [Pleuronectes platessa]|uniref:Uncharacterized protein n=1 Tax=Pleuronectes platessa TaxID=8262 RepID=A0A9N7YCT1_PLEPL|nr:unnamed protein product [Pleuronectes platessa]
MQPLHPTFIRTAPVNATVPSVPPLCMGITKPGGWTQHRGAPGEPAAPWPPCATQEPCDKEEPLHNRGSGGRSQALNQKVAEEKGRQTLGDTRRDVTRSKPAPTLCASSTVSLRWRE